MNWIKRQQDLLLGIAVIAAAFVVAGVYLDQRSADRDVGQRDTLVRGCVRSSARTSLNAAAWLEASAVRRRTGDLPAAYKYAALARGQIDTIPAPSDLVGSDELASVVPVDSRDEPITEHEFLTGRARARFRVTERAQALQLAGCQLAYPR